MSTTLLQEAEASLIKSFDSHHSEDFRNQDGYTILRDLTLTGKIPYRVGQYVRVHTWKYAIILNTLYHDKIASLEEITTIEKYTEIGEFSNWEIGKIGEIRIILVF